MLQMLSSYQNSSDSLSSSPESHVSHSLSSLINQRKLQKISSKAKATTFHYKKYDKKNVKEKVHGKVRDTPQHAAKRRRSSSYWYNTNINDAFESAGLVNNDEITKDPFINANFTSKKPKNNTESKLVDITIHNDLDDLDFMFEYSISDIKEFVEPVYDITKHRKPQDNSNFANIKTYVSNKMSSIPEYKDEVELVDIKLAKSVIEVPVQKPVQSAPKEIMQPHFMRLYALEQRSRNNGSLPDLDIDESLLAQLSYKDIWNLEVPTENTQADLKRLEEMNIKLALLTRKKLWCDIIVQREFKIATQKKIEFEKNSYKELQISGNDYDFIKLRGLVTSLNDNRYQHVGYADEYADFTSLVRHHKKTTLPWDKKTFQPGCDMISKLKTPADLKTIQPFGKLPNSKHTQYLVKGWVNKRFNS